MKLNISLHYLLSGKFLDEVYISWQPNEPNDSSGSENCLIMTKSAQMNDDGCQKKAPFVCKKTQSTVEWNALCDMSDTSKIHYFIISIILLSIQHCINKMKTSNTVFLYQFAHQFLKLR